LYGNDIDDTTSALEANLAFAVKLRDGNDFIDKELYQEQKNEGVDRELVAFELVDRGIPRKDYPIATSDGQEIGKVTSGTMSPVLKKGIGMGYVKKGHGETGKHIYIQIRSRQLKAEIVPLPFIKK
jgi:aminomethyltransferase